MFSGHQMHHLRPHAIKASQALPFYLLLEIMYCAYIREHERGEPGMRLIARGIERLIVAIIPSAVSKQASEVAVERYCF